MTAPDHSKFPPDFTPEQRVAYVAEFAAAIERMEARHIYVTAHGVLPDEAELRRVQADVHARNDHHGKAAA